MELYIVLAIMAFMIVGFVLNKWPFGLTAMTCCVLLAVTGVLKSGFCRFYQPECDSCCPDVCVERSIW